MFYEEMDPLVLLILLLAGSGFILSLVFGLTAARGEGFSALRRLCRMEEASCASLARHPDAHLAGVPNWTLGLVYYPLVVSLVLVPLSPVVTTLALLASWLAVAAGIYLVRALVVKIRVSCPLCFLAHAVNVALALTLTVWRTTRF